MDYGLPLYKINTATLGLYAEYPFYRTSIVNLKLDIAIRYNSSGTHKGMFGSGWQLSYESTLHFNLKEKRLALKKGSGQVLFYEAASHADFSNNAYYELVPVDKGKGSLFEYQDYYLYDDQQMGHMYIYTKSKDGSACILSRVSDYCGNAFMLYYRADGFLQEIKDPYQRSFRFEYDNSLCTQIILPDGREASISYNNGCIRRIANLAGTPIEFDYDGKCLLIKITVGKKMKTTAFTYTDFRDRSIVQTVADRNGSITRYEMLSEEPVTVQVTNPMGFNKKIVSRKGMTESIIDSEGRKIAFEYAGDMLVSVTDKNGDKQLTEYDSKGRPIRRTDYEGNTEVLAYDPVGNLSAYTDALGRTTCFAYDARRNLIRKEIPGGEKTIYNYDETGRHIQTVLPGGNVENYEYDTFSNLTGVRDNLGYTYRAVYDEGGLRPCEYIDAFGFKTCIKLDELDRLKEIKYPDGTVKAFEYDCCAGVVTRDQIGSTWLHERDPMSRITKKIDPTGSMKGYHYDENGRLVREIDELGNPCVFEYDADGYLVKSTDAMGGAVCKNRDAKGRVFEVFDENHNRFSFEYNLCNLVRKITDPSGNTAIYGYNAVNNLSFVITPGQHKISYKYDKNSNIVQKLADDKPVADITYNADGEIIRATDPTGMTEYRYDQRGRMTAAIYCEKERISISYDPADQLSEIKYPNGLTARYSYDSMGRIRSISWGGHEISITYDAAGRPAAEMRSNGTESRFAYDRCHRTVKIDHLSQGELIAGLEFSYDAAGNLVGENSCIPMLDTAADENIPENVAMSYNALNQMVKSNCDVCRYYADGNMIAQEGSRPADFSYDAENRLIAKNSTHGKTNYEYNAFNQLVRITRNGKVTYRMFDQTDRLLYETDGFNDARCHIYCHRQLAATVNADGSVCFYHYDHRGNTVVITNEKSQQVCAYSYLPYGSIRKKAEKITGNRCTFLGAYGVIDEKDGFYITANRCYDPAAGRFIQQDPLGFIDGQNLYTYANGNPLTRIDPEGTIIWLVPVFIIGGGYAAYKAVSSAKNVARDLKKIDAEKLDKAAKILDQYTKAFAAGRIDANLYWRARDNYTRLLTQVNNQAAQSAKTGVYEYALKTKPYEGMGDMVKDISCTPP